MRPASRSAEKRRRRAEYEARLSSRIRVGDAVRHERVAAVVQDVDVARETVKLARLDGERLWVRASDVVRMP